MRLRLRSALALGVVGAMAIVGCGSDDGDESSDPSSTTLGSAGTAATTGTGRDSELDRDGTLRFAWLAFGGQWDPHGSTNPNADFPYLSQVYDRLVQLGPDLELLPLLATDWEVADDGLSIDFELRDGVTFHDGTPFTAEAVVASLDRGRGEGSNFASQLANVQSVEATGDLAVRIVLGEPEPTILYTLATMAGAIISPTAITGGADLQTAPAGSGPYELDSFDQSVVNLVRNDDYWDPEQNPVARKEMYIILDDTARLNGLRSGQLDMIFMRPDPQVDAMVASGDYELHVYDANAPLVMYLNSNIEPLDDPNVRLALNLAIDREGISEALFAGECPAAGQPMIEGFVGHDPALDDGYDYDPERARELIHAAGAAGAELDVIQQAGTANEAVAEAVAAQLADVGITVHLTAVEGAQARPTWRQGTFAGFVGSMTVNNPDPSSYMDTAYLAGDNPGTVSGDIRAAADAAAAEPLGSPEREAAYEEVNRMIFEEPIHVPICSIPAWYLGTPEVANGDRIMNTRFGAVPDTRFLGLRAG